MTGNKRNRGDVLPIFIAVLFILIVVVGVAFFVVIGPAKEKVVSKVAEKTITSVAEESGVVPEEAEQIYDNMSTQDQQTVQELIEKHGDMETMKEAAELYQSGKTEELKEMARNELSEEELQQLKDIYQKYVGE